MKPNGTPWSIVQFENGTLSLAHPEQGNEPMHSKIGPEQESKDVYFAQAPWSDPRTRAHPVLWDVGLGTAANVVVTLRELDRLKVLPRVQIESFELDLGGLQAARQSRLLPELTRFDTQLDLLTSQGSCEFTYSPDLQVSWRLHPGDFLEQMAKAAAPSIIYYDFFSPKVNPELWTDTLFGQLVQTTRSKDPRPEQTTLITYCAASEVRRNLKKAGFHAVAGVGTAAKRETTVAQFIW